MVLTLADYGIICVYLAAITLFGSWFARFQKTTKATLGQAMPPILQHAIPPVLP